MFGYSEETSKDQLLLYLKMGDKLGQHKSIELPKQEGKETYTNNIGYLSDGRILVSYYFEDPYVEPQKMKERLMIHYTEGEDSETMNENYTMKSQNISMQLLKLMEAIS